MTQQRHPPFKPNWRFVALGALDAILWMATAVAAVAALIWLLR